MGTYRVEITEPIAAAPQKVYDVIADYHAGHPAILPARYFRSLRVLSGGRGAGTEIAVDMNVLGVQAQYRLVVSEPEPGRVLVEEDVDVGVTTTFTVEPVGDGSRSQVTIATVARTSPGLRGALERWLNPLITRRIYREELAKLAGHVQAEPVA